MRVVAVDVGGTNIKSAAIDSVSATEVEVRRTPTPQGDATGNALADAIAEIVRNEQKRGDVNAIGFVVPGFLDEEAGIVRIAGNLDFRDVPIVRLIQERVNLPVAFGHDVRAGAIAESRVGASRNAKNSIFVPIGTGIAAAYVIDGKVRTGEGYIGEIGHADVKGPLKCVCGRIGCFEANASASAISRRYEVETGQKLSAQEIAQLVREKDATAVSIWSDVVSYLALTFEWMCNVLGPETIVIGGGLAGATDLLLEPITQELKKRLTFQRVPHVVPAECGDDAGCLGAGFMALDLLARS